ncbi:unnamed protein product [Linum trigynum]|uniref:Uncharacterized protein n=1 Tax=Linum trigynum TaxID=586398 RepID=A0AAV2DMC3_9ROSI
MDLDLFFRKYRSAKGFSFLRWRVWNCSQEGALVASIVGGNLAGLGKDLSSDKIVEPKRAPVIPGMEAVKKARSGNRYGIGIPIPNTEIPNTELHPKINPNPNP